MKTGNGTRVGEHFDEHWGNYLHSIRNNLLCHEEMFAALETFLDAHFGNIPFTLVDVGCGDGSAIAASIHSKSITRYIGIDTAVDLIASAPTVLSPINCSKEFICEDMATAIVNITKPVDIIFASYALHHLTLENKIHFIHHCQNALSANGYLILVDGVIAPNQSRQDWLVAIEERYFTVNKTSTPTDIAAFKKHIHNDDFPESINTYREIANTQQWQDFQVIIDKSIFAFMVFKK